MFTKEKSLFFKGIAILFMLLLHLFGQPELYRPTYMPLIELFNNFELELGKFGRICISIYIFLSGFGMSQSNKNVLTRIKKIYINYIIAMLIFLPLILREKFNFIELLKNLIGVSHSYNGNLWFFKLYIILLILSPIFQKIKNFTLYILVIFSYSLAVIIKFFPKLSHLSFTIWFQLPFWGALFLVGYIFRRHSLFEKFNKKIKNKIILIVSILIIIFLRVKTQNIGGTSLDLFYTPILILLVNSLVKVENIFSKFLIFLGEHSTNIWLTHGYLILFYPKQVFSAKYSILILILILILTLAVSYTINIIILKVENFYQRKIV